MSHFCASRTNDETATEVSLPPTGSGAAFIWGGASGAEYGQILEIWSPETGDRIKANESTPPPNWIVSYTIPASAVGKTFVGVKPGSTARETANIVKVVLAKPTFTVVGQPTITKSQAYFVEEAPDGVAVSLPATDNALNWAEGVKIDGVPGINPSDYSVGPVQMIWKFYAFADYRSTRLSLTYPLPVRDVDRSLLTGPWYNPTLVRTFSRLGEELTVVLGDRPRFADSPSGKLPWNDPRTKEIDSLRLLKWGANFIGYICVQNNKTGVFFPPLRHLYWSIQFSASLDVTKPLGSRATIHTSLVQNSASQPGNASEAPAVFVGPSA